VLKLLKTVPQICKIKDTRLLTGIS